MADSFLRKLARRLVQGLVLSITCFAVPAFGQYAPAEVLDRGFQGRVLDVGEAVKAQYPDAWRNAHNGSEPTGTEFVRRWALRLRAQGYTVCVNGKRGSETLSQDVLAFPVTEGWARDTSGPGRRIMVVDVIGGAGAAGASLGFGPDTSGADGRCIDPYLEPGEGATPAPGPGPGTPATPAPPPTVDLGPILATVQRIEQRVISLEARPVPDTVDMALIEAFIDDMVGAGPGGGEPNHITDLKEREDKNRALLEQMLQLLQQIARSPILRLGR